MAQPKTQEELKRKQQEFLEKVAAAKEKRGKTLAADDISIDMEYGKNLPTATVSSKPSAPTYTAPVYVESDIVKQAQTALNTQLANKPVAYQSQWQTQLDDTINKILNREKFSYDLNGDALYQQYKDKYIQQGKLAMGDAIGQASAMTGGYGNSYAQSVGQQAYQAQLQNLNDIVPELWQMAYDKHNQEGQDLYNQYSMLGAQDDRDYGQYRDEVSDWLAERDYLADRYDSERNFDYGKYVDDRDFDYGVYRDSMSDYQWDKEYDLAASKVADDNDLIDESISESDIKQMQAILGVGQDGVWGPKSTAAAGGLSVEEAYKAWQNGTLKKNNVVDENSANITSFKNNLSPESTHDAIARAMYGPYTAYVGLKILEDKNLTEDEKAYLFSLYGVTDSDEQYLKDKGWLK